jgi:hypothetical protein
MSAVVISGDTSGTVTLQAPAVAGSTTINLPATSGTVSLGMVALGTITTTSGTSQSLSGLTLTGYKQLLLVCNGVQRSASGNITVGSATFSSATNLMTGHLWIDLTSGVGSFTNAAGTTGATGYTTSTTTITFTTSAGAFNAGSVLVYGVS